MSERVFSFRNQHREKGRKFQYALIFFVLRLENKCDDLTPIFSCLHMNMQKRRRAQKNKKARRRTEKKGENGEKHILL